MGIFSKIIAKKEMKAQISKEKAENNGFSETEYNLCNQKLCDEFTKRYDLNSAEGIRAIPKSEMERTLLKESSAVVMPEQILFRKATEHKKANRLDLAIECLYKANELMPYSRFIYDEDSYMRLVRYLKNARRFEEAETEGRKIAKRFGHEYTGDNVVDVQNGSVKPNYTLRTLQASALKRLQDSGATFVEASWIDLCCEKCGMYRGRIFSVSPSETRVPQLPSDFCFDCGIGIHRFYYGISTPLYCEKDQILSENNKPFVDTRTHEEKRRYEERQKEKWQEEIDRADYEWVQKYLPNLAPKSFGGYRRMRNLSSANFQKLKDAARNKGRDIGNEWTA